MRNLLGTLFLALSVASANAQSLSVSPAGGGVPGGASLTVQYNNAGAFGGMSGTSWDDTNRSLTITGATVATSKPILNLTQAWDDGGAGTTVFTGILFNATLTSGAATSLLMDLKTGGLSKLTLNQAGTLTTAGSISSSGGNVTAAANITGAGNNSLLQTRNGGTIWSSPASASWQAGGLDAASPVAQTLRVQGASGTNVAAAATFTIIGPQATGNAAPGDVRIQTGAVGASGTAASVATTALTIKGTTQNVEFSAQSVLKSYTVAALPTGVEGGLVNVSDQLTACPAKGGAFTGGGAVTCLAHFEEGAWVAP